MTGGWEVPVKVMLAGEHAVLTPRGRALAVATGPRLIATAVPSPGVTVLRVQARPGAAVRELMPELQNRIPAPEWAPEDHLPLAVWDAATCAVLPRSPRVVDLRWEDDPDGWRPVGTSAALAAALALALSDGDPVACRRIALAGHRAAQGGGSGYDVLTCLGGGVTVVSPGPVARSTHLAPGLILVEGDTGRRAPTRELLRTLEEAREADPRGLARALEAHRRSSAALIRVLTGRRLDPLAAAVAAAGETLEALDRVLLGRILTPEIRTLLEIATRSSVPARVSGGGGGDTVVGFAATPWLAARLRMRWLTAGFAARVVEVVGGPGSAP